MTHIPVFVIVRFSGLLLAAYGGCFLVKKCAELAFIEHRRSMIASDMIKHISTVFQTHIENKSSDI